MASSTAPIWSPISELLNPGRNFFGKYYDLFANVDRRPRKIPRIRELVGRLSFHERGGNPLDRRAIFIGNRLSRGEARIEHGRHIDLKAIRSPIIVFASWGDNITPPQQALNWIVDTYADEHEIKIRGQRIIYMIHDKVGHLGIFVSSSIAKKEHNEVTSTMKTIEALSPGLYEMTIDDQVGEGVHARFTVSFHERKMSDLAAFDDKRDEERDFAAIARLSELRAELYDLTTRPLVQAMVTQESADFLRNCHPSGSSGGCSPMKTPPCSRSPRPRRRLSQSARRPTRPIPSWLGKNSGPPGSSRAWILCVTFAMLPMK